ncbi:MAG: hypothetical protein BWY89_00703 [Bacteroidetes bacterium ADurb.BinA012]|nr:MAG: hypothetical protein BWY89_00703 [Bacteroidetes bacterium ADurb.BinA012]
MFAERWRNDFIVPSTSACIHSPPNISLFFVMYPRSTALVLREPLNPKAFRPSGLSERSVSNVPLSVVNLPKETKSVVNPVKLPL